MTKAIRIKGSIAVPAARIVPHVEEMLRDTQAGFRTSRGYRDYICILAWSVEWLLENNRPAFIAYIHIKAAFACLRHEYFNYSVRKFSAPRNTSALSNSCKKEP